MESLINQRYAKSTTDLLWNHYHTIDSDEDHISHMSFDLIHVFTHIPHHDDAQKIKLFTWCGYDLKLTDFESNVKKSITTGLKKDLDDLCPHRCFKRYYTIEEWRGIRPGNFMYKFKSEQERSDKERRRRLQAESVKKVCDFYNKWTSFGGETEIGIWGFTYVYFDIYANVSVGNDCFYDLML